MVVEFCRVEKAANYKHYGDGVEEKAVKREEMNGEELRFITLWRSRDRTAA